MLAAPYAYGAPGYGWGPRPFMAADGLVGFNQHQSAHAPAGFSLMELGKKKAPKNKQQKKVKKTAAPAKKAAKKESHPNFEKLLSNAGFGGLLPNKFQKLLKSNGFSLGIPATYGVPGGAVGGFGQPGPYTATGGAMTSGYAAGAGVSSPYGANVEAWPASPYGDLTAFSAPTNIPLSQDSTTAPYGNSGMDSAVPNPVDALTAPLAGDAFGAGAAANNGIDVGYGASPYGGYQGAW